MKIVEIDIRLDPVKDGTSWMPEKMKRKGRGALIIGTNGKYRVAEEEEATEIMDRLSGVCSSDYMGKTSFLVIYNSKKVLTAGAGKFLVGSALIVKGTNKGIAFLDEEDVEEAKAEFESRLATLCGSGIQFSAYEIS